MRNILFKTISIGAIMITPLISMASCSNAQNQIDVKTEITSSFFSKMKDVSFEKQLMDESLWHQFVQVFASHEDTDPSILPGQPNWRGEFWGKMMRGAVMCYKYTHDEALYNVLKQTVSELLDTQDEHGRISTYDQEKEFGSWDMWGRKYVMTGLIHFYDICHDDTFKQRIIDALKKHADYILEKIGNGTNQIDITETGYRQWKGLNSCTILEPMVNLYEITKDKKYLDFATYIIETGGVNKGNMIEEAKANNDPWIFPVRKAYESMSFFEGVYRYGKVVNDASLKNAALNYFNKVYDQEITVIGSGGYEEEQWHNGVANQTIPHTGQDWSFRWGQETCVTVTWMRILNILYEETHDIKFYERFANSAMNAFLGSFNVKNQPIEDGSQEGLKLPFDTYSPLCYEPRGINGGGIVKFLEATGDNQIYGCCQCNAPVSIGLMGLNYCRPLGGTLYLNEYFAGKVSNADEGVDINITNVTPDRSYETTGDAIVNINSQSNQQLMLRIPSWANEPIVKINDVVKDAKPNTYFNAGALKDVNKIEVAFNPRIKLNRMNDKVYLTYGQYVLAFDGTNNNKDVVGSIRDIQIENINVETIRKDTPHENEIVRFIANYKKDDDATVDLVLTNYSSAGISNYYHNDDDKDSSMVNVFFRNDY